MRQIVLAIMLLVATSTFAADIEVGIQHLNTIMTGEAAFDGGEIEVVSSRGYGVTGEVFWSPRFSTQLAATFINPAAFLRPQDMDLQTLGTNVYSATARYHFTSASRFTPFAGGGAALATFRNLDERFGESYELEVEATPALMVEGGVRFRFRPRIHFDFTLTYMPVEADVNVVRNTNNIAVPSTIGLDPVTMKAGASWRF